MRSDSTFAVRCGRPRLVVVVASVVGVLALGGCDPDPTGSSSATTPPGSDATHQSEGSETGDIDSTSGPTTTHDGATATTSRTSQQVGRQLMAQSVTRIATTPLGAEITGLALVGDDLFMNYQHPDGTLDTRFAIAGVGVFANADFDTEVAIPTGEAQSAVTSSLGEYQVLAFAGDDGIGVIEGVTSAKPDMNSYIATGAATGYLFTNWEERPGGMSRMAVTREEDGTYRVGNTEMIDFRGVNGTWMNCFGTTSPWNTPLSAEELLFAETDQWNNPDEEAFAQRTAMADYLGKFPNPYDYGYIVEMTQPTDTPTPVKRMAMGRYSHENAVVMPDERTVYLSDDESGTVLFKFIADTPGDLSAGTLFAAKVTQRGEPGADTASVTFDVEWIELGSSDDATVNGWVREYDGITPDDYGTERGYITDDEIAAWANGDVDDDRVAFLESRKAAAALGATAEWRKMEGININFDAALAGTATTAYMAVSNINETMSDDVGDIQLEENACGAVFAMDLTDDWDITSIRPYVVGGPPRENDENSCSPDNIAGPDNLVVRTDGSVVIGEDTDGHLNNMLWLAR